MNAFDNGATNAIFESDQIREEMGDMTLSRARRIPDHAVIARRACEWAEAKREVARWAENAPQHCIYMETNPHKISCLKLGALFAPKGFV